LIWHNIVTKWDFVLESYKAKFNSLYLQMTFGGNVNQIVYMCRLFLLLVLTSNVRSINVQGQIKVGYFLWIPTISIIL